MADEEPIQEEITMQAKAEWGKFAKVAALLNTVNEYMAIYNQLQESGELVIVGSFGDKQPRHEIPSSCTEETWSELPLQEKYQELIQVAQQTELHMDTLGQYISEQFDVAFSKGPLKGEARIMQKCNEDYDGDILRVIDMARCSMTFVMESLDQAKMIIESFKEGTLSNDWELIRVKDGFEKPDNFLVGGYRDIKVNVKCIATGHLIEMQLHLQPYYQLKHNGGHLHYRFARQQKVQGITNATQILNMGILPEIVLVGMDALENASDDRERVEIVERLGDLRLQQCNRLNYDDGSLEKANLSSEAVYYYDQGLRTVERIEDFLEDTAGKASYCQLLIGLAQGLSEFGWALYYGERYYDDMKERSKLPDILFPELGMNDAIAKSKCLLGERHPVTLEAKAGVGGANYLELIKEQRTVLGFDHPMVLETVNTRFNAQEDVWDKFYAFNDLVDILEVNLDRLGINHPSILVLLQAFCVQFQVETKCFWSDAPGSRVPDLLRMLSKPKWDNESCHASLEVLRSSLRRTVESVDADKIKVGSRVAVWSWYYQDYWSGKVTEVKEGGGVFCVEYDLPGSPAWVSPRRRHTLLLSHGSEDPTPLPQSTANEMQVGKRALIWYGNGYDSFFAAVVQSRDETKLDVMYDTGEPQVIPLECLDGSLPFCVTTRNDAGSVDSVEVGDNLYVYWKFHKTYWLGEVKGLADGEEDKETPTKYRMQYYSGDLQICDLSEMPFFPEAHPTFSH
ncbi:unnamed protein product [Cylindrotheca closterium]|uniref:Uncharacterized protein n=1 Tax=Cylindrotheca closterium TaxID=2856 RepID=A0AAD2GB05_9STRA|nr:unnamed protein product [Cylindrotheca closterium]